MTLKIGSYEISTQELYDTLQELKVTDDADLKLLDANGDSIISEDDFVDAAALEEEASENKDSEDSSKKSKWEGKFSGTTLSSILSLEASIESLEEELRNARARICKTTDASELSDIISSMQSTMSSINSTKLQIYNLMVQAENSAANASSAAGSANATNTIANGTSIESSAGTASAIAEYGLQYAGKSESEMSSIMSGKGYAFNSGQWCADFVSFCTGETYGSDVFTCSNCKGFGDWARENNILMDDREGLTVDLTKVKPGDYIIYNAPESSGSWYHIGIVTAVHPESGTVDTVEGNTGNGECATHENVDIKTGGSKGTGASFILAHNIYGTTS